MNARLKLVARFSRESSDTVINEIAPLLAAHYAEIAHYQDIPVCVDYDRYLQAEANDQLRIYTVRDGLSLVGYALFAVGTSPKYSTSLQAIEDVLYLDPDYRRGRIGTRFIDWCDHQLQLEGVQVVYRHVKAAHNFGPLLKRLGYTEIDHIYGRRLDGR